MVSAADSLNQAQPFLFTHTFNGHLKVAGGNFTVGRPVYLVVKYDTGPTAFSRRETARTRSITPGGPSTWKRRSPLPAPGRTTVSHRCQQA
ncbi:hypothetical protein ABZV14_38090 [Streptosporangium canum]|uniref:hypothetical protein n=1 Tax=Streptosporangium canum TaxID=324952 RepID=UPI0033A6199A